MHNRLLSVIIPIYNEKELFKETLRRVIDVKIKKEILIVDDASSDGTAEKIRSTDWASLCDEFNTIKVFYHEKNQGKGAAMRTGLFNATGDIMLVQDADHEYNPSEYGKLLKPIMDGRADIVYGSRFLGRTEREILSFWHYMGNRMLTLATNIIGNVWLTDMETCYKAFTREVLDTLHIRSNRFGFEPEITMKLVRNKRWRIYEVPITYSPRDYSQGKKIHWTDGFTALFCIVYFRFFD